MNEFNLNKKYNWETAHNPLVKKYVADLYQTGTTAPVATELFNNTDTAFTFDYVSVGTYIVTANKPIFSGCTMGCPPGQKVQVTLTNSTFISDVAGPTGYSLIAFPVSDNTIIILSSDLAGAGVDAILGTQQQNAIEITVYP
jgi:hypothetical protein